MVGVEPTCIAAVDFESFDSVISGLKPRSLEIDLANNHAGFAGLRQSSGISLLHCISWQDSAGIPQAFLEPLLFVFIAVSLSKSEKFV